MTSTPIQQGDIVALLSHPYHEKETDIIFSGDPLQQAPLMVVSECLQIKKKGDKQKVSFSVIQHKCYWYSQKSSRFESAWIDEKFLKVIEKAHDLIDELPEIGSQLLFRTVTLELRKRKSSLLLESGLTENTTINISSLMTFVSPVLIVSGYKEKEIKETDTAEGGMPSKKEDFNLIKVKWFNFLSDKISETLLPITCLKVLERISAENLNELRKVIDNDKFIKTKSGKSTTFLKPISINYLNGYYLIRSYDFLANKMINDLNLLELDIKDILDTPVIQRAPVFNFKISGKPITYPLEIIEKAEKENKIIRIKYVNRYNKESTRCVKDFTVHKIIESEEEHTFLTGFCLSKKDLRHFNVKNIEWVELLNLDWNEYDLKGVAGVIDQPFRFDFINENQPFLKESNGK